MPRIVQARPGQIRETWRLNHQEWGDGLTLEDYFAREEAQVATYASTSDASPLPRQIHWLLCPDDSDAILAACESLYRAAVDDSGARIPCYSIASVFVAPALRGHGYASLLMSLLSQELRDRCRGSALFSDVGPVFYARSGWDFYESSQVTLTLDPQARKGNRGVNEEHWITESGMEEACQIECRIITEQVRAAGTGGTEAWSFLPTGDVLRWHHARNKFTAKVMGQGWLDRLGYACDGGLCLWTLQPDKRLLLVLRIRFESRAVLATLLEAAVAVACDSGAEKIVVWDAREAEYSGILPDVQVVHEERKGSLNALQIYGAQKVNWLNKEKFCWC